MNRTLEQLAIREFLSKGDQSLIINALAGSGKTWTLLDALDVVPQKTVMLTAFNKRIAEELGSRMPPKKRGSVWKSDTFHANGMRVINANKRGTKLDLNKDATEELVNQAVDAIAMYQKDFKISFLVRRAATKLLRYYKETFSMPEINVDEVKIVGLNADILTELSEEAIEQTAYVVAKAYDLGIDFQSRTSIDFCDMIWLPVVADLAPPSRYQSVFVDELQDLSLLQWELIQKLVIKGGRIVGVGDLNQGIYGWRGAIGQIIFDTLTKAGAVTLPLTTTFRCSKAVVYQAQALVPEIQAASTALEGAIEFIDFGDAIDRLMIFADNLIPPDDGSMGRQRTAFVLSRTNAELIRVAIELHREDVDFDFLGAEEIMFPLRTIVEKLDKSTSPRFQANLDTWYQVESIRAEKQHASEWADKLENYYGILCLMNAYARSPAHILAALQDMTARSVNAAITLSSVHKSKGLEADDVYLMQRTFHRHQPWRKELPTQEEKNIEYVAITRSRDRVIWVDAEPARFR